jgi:hypothetical protein
MTTSSIGATARPFSRVERGASSRPVRAAGRLVLTVPVGYHPALEAALRTGAVPLARAGALRRRGTGPRWREVALEQAWGTPYDFLRFSARAVVIAELTHA